ncbi:MAG TPA: glycosyltransferase, partial [Anaerolineales bacterium]|nr:glycosyltransferase [Anaerolineales bacterium]
MRVLFLAGREIEYSRNDVLLRAFGRIGEVHPVVEHGKGTILLRSMRVFLRSIPTLRSGRFDLIFVGFYGHFLVLPVSSISSKPVLFDAFVSTYDTLVDDRGRLRSGSIGGNLASWLDKSACSRADGVLIDTPEYRRFFVENFRVPEEKIWSLPVGCNESIFVPKPGPAAGATRILFYCNYLPLHGVDVVVKAAWQLRGEPDLEFRLVGGGQEYRRVRALAEDLGVDNVRFLPPISLVELSNEIADATICLGGPFGRSQKAGRVIPGKIYQLLAMEKPVIAGDTEANRGFLEHSQTAIFCAPGSPEALADSILQLQSDPGLRRSLARSGRKLFES